MNNMKKGFNKELGDRGEQYAVNHLVSLGYKILYRNVRMKGGEIDIIALENEELVFVEVKTRSSLSFGHPLDGLTQKKQLNFNKAVEEWIAENGKGEDLRIDVIGITANGTNHPLLEHIKSAF